LPILVRPANGESGARAGAIGLDRHVEGIGGSKGIGLFGDGLVGGDAPPNVDLNNLHASLCRRLGCGATEGSYGQQKAERDSGVLMHFHFSSF
jgi:hypothetical protein